MQTALISSDAMMSWSFLPGCEEPCDKPTKKRNRISQLDFTSASHLVFFCKTIFRKVAISYVPVQNYCESGAASRERKGIIGVVVCVREEQE